MARSTLPAALSRELKREGFDTNIEVGRRYLMKAAEYADAAGLSETHERLMTAVAAVDDARESAGPIQPTGVRRSR
jgi:hypothetical protein